LAQQTSSGLPMLAAICILRANGVRREKCLITDFPPGGDGLGYQSKRILEFFAESSCAVSRGGCRNSFTATTDPRFGSNPGSGAGRR
jgi:hypothetical protein